MPRGWVPVNMTSGFYKLPTDDDAPGASNFGLWVGALNTGHNGPM